MRCNVSCVIAIFDGVAKRQYKGFTYNLRLIMKLSYKCAFVPEGTPIVCYNRASFFGRTAFSYGFRN